MNSNMHMFLEHKDIHYILTLHVNIAVFAYEKNKYSCHGYPQNWLYLQWEEA